jgi:hypothetical protein
MKPPKPQPAALPSREQLLAWGLAECGNAPTCRILLNPEIGTYCLRCQRQRDRRRRRTSQA